MITPYFLENFWVGCFCSVLTWLCRLGTTLVANSSVILKFGMLCLISSAILVDVMKTPVKHGRCQHGKGYWPVAPSLFSENSVQRDRGLGLITLHLTQTANQSPPLFNLIGCWLASWNVYYPILEPDWTLRLSFKILSSSGSSVMTLEAEARISYKVLLLICQARHSNNMFVFLHSRKSCHCFYELLWLLLLQTCLSLL